MLGLGNSLVSGSPSEQNYSLHFDGTNDYLATGTDGTKATKSYSFWAKSDVTVIGVSNAGIFGHGGAAIGAFHKDTTTDNPLLFMGSGYLRKWCNTAVAVDDGSVDPAGSNNWEAQIDGEWHHWVVYIEHDDISNCKLWIDGVPQADTTTTASGSAANYTSNLTIATSTSHYYDGLIDDFAIFNVELDTDNVVAIYNSGKPFDLNYNRGGYDESGNLEGYWRMDDGGGTTVVDSSGEGNNATVTNGAVFSTDTPDD